MVAVTETLAAERLVQTLFEDQLPPAQVRL